MILTKYFDVASSSCIKNTGCLDVLDRCQSVFASSFDSLGPSACGFDCDVNVDVNVISDVDVDVDVGCSQDEGR